MTHNCLTTSLHPLEDTGQRHSRGLDISIFINILYSGLIISGGRNSDDSDDSAGHSVEVYVPSTGRIHSVGQLCRLPDLPDNYNGNYWRTWRVGHTMEKLVLCGGGETSKTRINCLTLTDAGWEVTTTLLLDR